MLWHAALGWKAEVAAALEPHGLTPTQFFVLGSTNLLSREDASGARQVDIARLAGLDVMTTSQTVRLLEAGGWVKRTDDPNDSRSWRVVTTPEGAKKAEAAGGAVGATTRAFFATERMSPAALRDVLKELMTASDARRARKAK